MWFHFFRVCIYVLEWNCWITWQIMFYHLKRSCSVEFRGPTLLVMPSNMAKVLILGVSEVVLGPPWLYAGVLGFHPVLE